MPFFPKTDTANTTRLSVRYIDDHILLSDDAAWTYVRIPPLHYDFIPDDERIAHATRFTIALTALVSGYQELDCHLLLVHRRLPTELWADALNARAARQGATPGWKGWLSEVSHHLDDTSYLRRDTYLGIKLGNRGDTVAGVFGELMRPLKKIVGTFEKSLAIEDFAIDPKELKQWQMRAQEIRRSLADSHLRARAVSADQLAWMVSRPLWPSMDCPSPTAAPRTKWGPGDVIALAEGVVDNGHRMLRIEQTSPSGEPWVGHVATLSTSRFPDTLVFPVQEPWLLYASSLDFPVDMSLRFALVPPRKVHADVKKKLADARDQAAHIAEGGLHVPLQVQETLNAATMLEYSVEKHQSAWVYGMYRFIVSGPTEEITAARARRLQEHYRDLAIDLVWPTGDQFDLLLESMPGDRIHGSAYLQRQESIMIGGGMPHATTEVGDRVDERGKGWVGPYLGVTTHRQAHPVFLSPHVAMARDASPGTAIIGAPGGGKALALDTPIPTPTGWTAMGDIAAGDQIFAADGTVTTVTHAHPYQYGRNCFTVTFPTGSIVADEDHLWAVTDHWTGTTAVRTTAEIADLYTNPGAAFYIEPTAALNPGMGEWLTVDAAAVVEAVTATPDDSRQRGNTLVATRIPHAVLRGTISQRHTVMNQLLLTNPDTFDPDTLWTDSYPTPVHVWAEAADSVAELARSLGYTADITPHPIDPTRATVTITANSRHYLISVTPTPSVPVRCITVDHPSHLFLAGPAMVPTHNSFSAFTLAHQMAMQGVWTIYLDPKADAVPMASLPGLGDPQLFDLRHGDPGMLDPFTLGDDPAHGKLLALETARLLLGGHMSEEREEAFTQALDYVATQPNPSLMAVVDVLAQHPDAGGRNLATVLRNIKDLPFARLCFAPNGGTTIRPENGLTIITLLGLSLPPSGKQLNEYGYEERLAVAVMYLLTRYARRLMLSLDKNHPKAICIDEAWAITATDQGAQMIPEVARMGRSHNTALVLVTQNAKDLLNEGVANSITTKMAFRSTNIDEIRNVLQFFGLPLNDFNRDMIRNLRNGECLLQDVDGRVTRVQVDNWNKRNFEAFNTNPETRGRDSGGVQTADGNAVLTQQHHLWAGH